MPFPPDKQTPRYRFRDPEPPRPRKRGKGPMILAVLGGLLTALLIFLLVRAFAPPDITISVPFMDEKTISFPTGAPRDKILLVMGVDYSYDGGRKLEGFAGARTDTMMLVRFNPRRKTVNVVSIPRDSKVYMPRGGVDKINAAYAYGGAEYAVETVEKAFGIPIDNHLTVDFQVVHELVETMGGVDLYIEKPMRYRDRTAGLFINFEQGQQTLNGQQAEEFLRFRHDQYGDIGRVRRQQQFIVAVSQKLKSPKTLTKLPKLVEIGSTYVHTDMSLDDMMRMAGAARDISPQRIRSATLPGRTGWDNHISYWVVDPNAAQLVLDRLILHRQPLPDKAITEENPGKVGIMYTPTFEESLPELIRALEQGPFEVVCKSRQNRGSTQIIEHTPRVTDETTHQLQKLDSGRLANARLIFAPVGSTFESNHCSGSEDYTIVIGGDAL